MSNFPSTIQAIAISKTGGIEVLERQSVPFPKQEPNQVLVKVRRTPMYASELAHRITLQVNYGGVNTIDTYFR